MDQLRPISVEKLKFKIISKILAYIGFPISCLIWFLRSIRVSLNEEASRIAFL